MSFLVEKLSIDEAVKALDAPDMTRLKGAFTQLGYIEEDTDAVQISYIELLNTEGALCDATVKRSALCEED